MKKKSENKNISAEAENTAKDKTVKEMSDAEFDRYIDGIMIEENSEAIAEASESQAVMADDIQALRDDMNKIIAELGALGEAVRSTQAEATDKAVPTQAAPVPAQVIPAESVPVPVNEADKAKLYDQMMAQQKRYQLFRMKMKEQEDDIKKYFADFNFNFLYDNDPEFKAEFDKMGSVYGAYLKYLARHTAPVRGFVENGAMPAMAAGSVSTSPAGLPDKEFDEYIRNILGE